MTDMKFYLERSAYFNNRSKLLLSNGVPKLSDAKANLGDSLAKVVFEQCEKALRTDFGLKEPLNGPGDMLWVSPSDLLIGKVALKPPFTPKCLQALTHKGILEIGEDLENRFKQEMEQDKQKTLDKYKSELLATVEDRMKSEIKDVEIRERLNCHMEIEKQQQEFELILKHELNKLESKVREEYEQIINKNEEQLKHEWEEKLQREVKIALENITKEFLVQLDEQEEKLMNAFQLELKKKEILQDFKAKMQKCKMADALRTLKHGLECRNLVNMMYILCTERRKCCEKKELIENYYQKIVSDLEEKITEKDNKITELTKEKEQQKKEVLIRETCLQEVIKHFQKFINFALRAAPTQAEFLLSVEKMMVFELTTLVAESEFPAWEKPVIPWKHESKTKTLSVTSNLEISDHHNCLNELNPPTPMNGSEIGADRILPAIYLDDNTYVREDFRDMLSSGLEIRSSNEMWNKDVEILIESWRKQSTEIIQIKTTQDENSINDSGENLSGETSEKNRNDYIKNERFRAKPNQQIMSDLPKDRVSFSRPFQKVGVDYAGPFLIKSSRLKKASIQKCYAAIFVCMATKAVHIEVVSDLSTQTFLASLKRFISRRENPSVILSDNGTNFLGAKNYLRELREFFRSPQNIDKINGFLSPLEIKWQFIPPRSPHWGGLWESAVKSAKYHLVRIVGNANLTFEELTTVFVQIESIMNSRPLSALSNDPLDLDYLSPGHFLIGTAMTAYPERNLSDKLENRLTFWQRCSQMQQQFWKRWAVEYLNRLQNRPKWLHPSENLKVGDLVLLKEDKVPPLTWPRARITEVMPGSDGKVRVVKLKTPNGEFTRSITKICPLPQQDSLDL